MTPASPKTSAAPSRERVLELARQGLSPREIAALMDISVQRVYQHIWRLRELGELPQKEAS